jgi:DNA-binding NarL/FixJ family response regulator
MDKISILIADDHRLFRELWGFVLGDDPRFSVIASTGDAADAVAFAKTLRPQIVLMDINMMPFSGLEATPKIRKVSPASRIIGLSMHALPLYAKKMLQLGASGYVTKNSSSGELIEAILSVSRGERYMCVEMRAIIADHVPGAPENGRVMASITGREMQVIEGIKLGRSSKEIAQELEICLKTVEVHRHNILTKLKLKNAAALVNFMNAAETGADEELSVL